MMCRLQDTIDDGRQRIPVVHVPKTIDNDYNGIDFTFGYFTAVDQLATEVRNLLYDAEADARPETDAEREVREAAEAVNGRDALLDEHPAAAADDCGYRATGPASTSPGKLDR